jgi:hypothetical protein
MTEFNPDLLFFYALILIFVLIVLVLIKLQQIDEKLDIESNFIKPKYFENKLPDLIYGYCSSCYMQLIRKRKIETLCDHSCCIENMEKNRND